MDQNIKADVQFEIMSDLFDELDRAEKQHPAWPEDIIHQVAIMGEESGDALQAAIQQVYEGGDMESVEKELVQTGAMVIRCLQNIRGVR